MTDTANPTRITYADAGVNIEAGNALVNKIKPMVARTHRTGILGGLGGFGGMFELPVDQYRHPVMVSGADGVGTKLRLAIDLNKTDQVGIDLVAMCVNDILVSGAAPLWFLDYFATGKLDVEQASNVISGIAEGCVQAGAVLLGGETAEMPGMYHGDDFDLAGFAVGVVEKADIIDGSTVTPGDAIIGIHSSGPHSNGYSLIRKIAEQHDMNTTFNGTTLGQTLLEPTRIYVKAVHAALESRAIKAMAHITGGGLTENIPRCLPDGVSARIDTGTWTQPAIFDWIQQNGNVSDQEMQRTFNCGIGMALIVTADHADAVIHTLQQHGEASTQIGSVEAGTGAAGITVL